MFNSYSKEASSGSLWCAFIFILLVPDIASAQQLKGLLLHEVSSANSITEVQSTRLNKLLSKKYVQDARVVKFQSKTILGQRRILLNLDENRTISASHIRTDHYGNGGAVWNGELSNGSGTVQIAVNGEELFVTLYVQDTQEHFSIQHLDGDLYALVTEQHDDSILIDSIDHIEQTSSSSSSKSMNTGTEPETSSSSITFDTILFYTDDLASVRTVTSINNGFNSGISFQQSGFNNSGVSITSNVVLSVHLNFNETGNAENDLETFRNHHYVKYMRDRYNADVAILMKEGPAGSGLCGLATDIPASYTEAFALVSEDCVFSSTNMVVTAHEIGHLQGAYHDNSGSASPSYAKGYVTIAGGYRTIMAINYGAQIPAIQYFSDDTIIAPGFGQVGNSSRDVARRLKETDNTIAGFETLTSFSLIVDGPSCIQQGSNGYFSSSPLGGYGIPDVDFEFFRICGGGASPDKEPFDVSCGEWNFAGSGTSVSGGDYINFGNQRNDDFLLRSTGSDENNASATSLSIYVEVKPSSEGPCNGSAPNGKLTIASDKTSSEGQQTVKMFKNYPNPFNPQTNISFQLSEAAEIRLIVYDVLGREIEVLANGVVQKGFHEYSWNAETLPSGSYFYTLQVGDQIHTEHMILSK